MFSITDKSSLLSLLWFSVPSPPHPSICQFSSPLSIIKELGHALLKFPCSTTYSSTSLLQTPRRHTKCTGNYSELRLDVTQDAFVSNTFALIKPTGTQPGYLPCTVSIQKDTPVHPHRVRVHQPKLFPTHSHTNERCSAPDYH